MTLKNRILQIFENHRGESISGQQLADELCVSRNSVWKSVKSRQNEGYRILAATNKGYILEEDNDIVSRESVIAALGDRYSLADISVLKTTPSTNTEAMTRLLDGRITHGSLRRAVQGQGKNGQEFLLSQERYIYERLSV